MARSLCLRRILPLLAAVAFARGGRAAEPAPLDPAQVASSAAGRAPGLFGEEIEIVVRGPRRPQAAAAVAPGASVTVVDAERFAGEAKGAGAMLATSPGVAVTEQGAPGQASTVSIRGASAQQVKVLLDGVPLNSAAGGGVDLSTIPPQWISRIEVVRGTEGVHHGTGALGGVVNVVTAPPRAGAWSASATAGSFGTYQSDAQVSAGGEGWGVLGSVAGTTTTGRFPYLLQDPPPPIGLEREHDASETAGALLKGFAEVGGGRLDAAAQLSGGRRELPGTPSAPTPLDWQEDARGLLSARFRRPAGASFLLSASGSARVDRVTARLEDLGGSVVRQRGLATTAAASAAWCRAHGSAEATVEAGQERLQADGMGDHERPILALILAGELTGLDGRARLGPGIRLERVGDARGASAKLGGSLGLAGPLSLRASVGRTYRVPSFAELYLQQGAIAPNPALRPETGIGGDAALVAEGARGTASIGAFQTLYDDLIVYQAVSFRRLAPVNADRSLVRGLEAELASAPLRQAAGLTALLAYTLTDSQALRGREDILGLDLPRMPRHRLYARLGVGGAAADAHGVVQYVSRQFLAFGRYAEIGPALTWDAGASVRLCRTAGLRLHVEIRNLLDVRTLDDSYGNPLPGRTVLVTLRAGQPPKEPI
ncbi:MAG TPA: TonB-dependent receptor [Anaeromyxobacter sp.]